MGMRGSGKEFLLTIHFIFSAGKIQAGADGGERGLPVPRGEEEWVREAILDRTGGVGYF
jgi:hypothetical protein